jgi:hypothetical protein
MTDQFAALDAVAALIATSTGRAAFVGEATGRPLTPYCVVNPDWEPEPDIGQPMLDTPGAFRTSIQVNAYGRTNVDALWLDSAVYTLITSDTFAPIGVNVIWRDADDSPVLSRTNEGLMLGKRWYRLVYLVA